MTYQLGIDLGTASTSAALCRIHNGRPGSPEVFGLGARSAAVPSVVHLPARGEPLVGDVAERRALTEPGRVVRALTRRIGDDTPVVVGGVPHAAHDLAARLVAWVVHRVAEQEGRRPERIALTHPAGWGDHKTELLAGALRRRGVEVTFVPEPVAAAVSYASAVRVPPGAAIAVYDLGGTTFHAAVVRRTGDGFEIAGRAEHVERLGGDDFTEAVLEHVRRGIGDAWDALDPEDPATLAAVAQLRRQCVEAKEALSSDTEAGVTVLLPGVRTSVRLIRAEFEAMIRPAVEETVDVLRRTIEAAGVRPDELAAVLLVGGSARIPLVAEMVSTGLDRPVVVDADPRHAVAIGAALAVSRGAGGSWPAVRMAPVPSVPARGPRATGATAPPRPLGPVPAGPVPARSGPSGPSGPPPAGPPRPEEPTVVVAAPRPAAPPPPAPEPARPAVGVGPEPADAPVVPLPQRRPLAARLAPAVGGGVVAAALLGVALLLPAGGDADPRTVGIAAPSTTTAPAVEPVAATPEPEPTEVFVAPEPAPERSRARRTTTTAPPTTTTVEETTTTTQPTTTEPQPEPQPQPEPEPEPQPGPGPEGAVEDPGTDGP